MFTDPIADMLTRIRNAAAAHKAEVVLPYSKFKHSLAQILEKEGFVRGVTVKQGHLKELVIALKYDSNGEAIITGIKRISKPGQRIYVPMDRIPRVHNGLGISVISTSKGLMVDSQARKERYGGELICEIW